MLARRCLGGALTLALIGTLGSGACGGKHEGTTHDAALSDGGVDGAPPDAEVPPPDTIAEHHFGAFEAWATPIEDYLAVAQAYYPNIHDARINELAPFGERMWIGYGDATYNLGERTPIEFRYFVSVDDPTPQSAVVDGAGQGAEQQTLYQSGEEQIDRYRICDGELWQAGIDSIDPDEAWTQANTNPPGIEGNVYSLTGSVWAKFRSISGGEHVHDVCFWQGAIYAVGSGADFRTEFEAGEIFRYLWRSTDGGADFATVRRIAHPSPGEGDTRWVHLLPTTANLFLFGYESDFQTNRAYVSNATFDGSDIVELDATDLLGAVYPSGTEPLPDGAGLLYGVDVSQTPLRYVVVHVDGDGTAIRLGSFEGMTVLDVYVHGATGEIVYLAREGDLYSEDPTEYQIHVLVAPVADPGQTVDLVQLQRESGGYAIAYWNHAMFLGTPEGTVLKAIHGG